MPNVSSSMCESDTNVITVSVIYNEMAPVCMLVDSDRLHVYGDRLHVYGDRLHAGRQRPFACRRRPYVAGRQRPSASVFM